MRMLFVLKLFVFFLLFNNDMYSQFVRAITKNGNEERYSLNDNLRITFDSTSFVFHNGNQVLRKWGYGEVIKIEYSGVPISNIGTEKYSFSNKIQVSPHPLLHVFTVYFQVSESGHKKLTIYNTIGEVISTESIGIYDKGIYEQSFLSPTPIGTYIICIEGNNSRECIPVVKYNAN
jgi:hypothetical protein